MGRRIAGKSAEEVFKAPHLAELANAACDGDATRMARAISAGADPNGLSTDDGTPLLWAVYCNNPPGVEALLKAGANPNYKAQGKYTPTFAAATAENPKVLRLLLAHGGDPNADDGGSWSALRYAMTLGAQKGRWENYYSLLEAGVDINRLNHSGQGIADYAAYEQKFDKVAELLDRGYKADLPSLAATVQIIQVAPGRPTEWKAKVIAMLEARGVKPPVPR
jgi:ankyrin repeat protein